MKEHGQGLIETIIAIAVVITGIIGAVSLVNFTIKSATFSLNRMIAQNLAWEAVEVVVNIRDSNVLAGVFFDSELTSGTGDDSAILIFNEASNFWSVDFGAANDFGDTQTILYRQGGVYSHDSSGTPTGFQRYVRLIPSAESIRVVAFVQWQDRQDVKSLFTETFIFDWRGEKILGPGVCGDGNLNDGEACDDGDTSDNGTCNATCTAFTYCGDGTVQDPNGAAESETCDDGNTNSGDGCDASCQTEAPAICGNGVLEPGEVCEQGDSQACTVGDYNGTQQCNSTCDDWLTCVADEYCGDGIINGIETCDDGNTVSGDGCNASCQIETFCDTDSMISWWDAENTANDKVGTNHGTLVGDTVYSPGKVGQAFEFDGTGDYVNIPHDPGLNIETRFTISFWMKPDLLGDKGIFEKGNSGNSAYELNLYSDYMEFRIQGYNYRLLQSSALSSGTWYNVAITYDMLAGGTDEMKLYVNGVVNAVRDWSDPLPTNSEPLVIGKYYTDIYGFDGIIDEFTIYNRALSSSEIQEIFDAGSIGVCSSL